MARDFLEELNALVDEANNLVRKLHDDEDSDFNDNFNDWHQMVIIKRDLMQLYPLVCYELVLRSIEKNTSDEDKFNIAKSHYWAMKIGRISINDILNDCKNFTIHAGYAGYFTEKARRFVEDVKDSFFSDSEESED